MGLMYLNSFSCHPTTINSKANLKHVIAFFFGNGVPVQLACQFFHACNGKISAHVTIMFHHWYNIWLESRNKPHMFNYYNMCLGKHIYINGSYLNQLRPVRPEIPVSWFGIDNTGFPRIIRSMLEHVSQQDVHT